MQRKDPQLLAVGFDQLMPDVLQQFSEGKRRKTLTKCAVETGCGEKCVPWKDLKNDGTRTVCTWDVEYFLQERKRVKRFPELAEEEKQAGIQGQRQLKSPAREYLEQVRCCHDTDCNEPMMKKGFAASKNAKWEENKDTFKRNMKATEWAFKRVKETFELVAQVLARKVSIVQEIMFKSTDTLRAYHRASWRTRRSPNVLLVPALQQFPFGRLHFGWTLGKNIQIGGVRSVKKNSTGSNRTCSWWCKQAKVSTRPRSSERMQYLRPYAESD